MARFQYYTQAISEGQILPTWISSVARGYGYPLFIFSFHLPWIIGTIFINLGFSFDMAFKSLMFLAFFLSGVSMYFLSTTLFKNRLSGLLSALLYLWAPYHFFTILVGASIGTVFVFVFLPLLLLGIYILAFSKEYKWGIILTALSLAGIILSNLIMLAVIFPVFLGFLIWVLISTKQKANLLKFLSFSVFLGLLLSSFYLIPAIFYKSFTQVGEGRGFFDIYKSNFVNFSQLLYSKWGFGPITSNAKDGEVSFQIGIAQWFSLLGVMSLLIFKRIPKTFQSLDFLLLGLFGLVIFLMLDQSKPLWDLFTKFIVIDYPFKFLMIALFLGSLASGLLVKTTKFGWFLGLGLVLVALYTNRNHLKVSMYTNHPPHLYLWSEITTTTFHEYLPNGASVKLINEPESTIIPKNIKFSDYYLSTKEVGLKYKATESGQISLKQFDFPGQKVYLDNKLTKHTAGSNGLITFETTPGTHQVKVKYEKTPLMKFSLALSLIGVLIILLLMFKSSLTKLFKMF